MSNFLDLEESPKKEPATTAVLRDMLASVPVSKPRPHLNPAISDELATNHGFSSRDHSDRFLGGVPGRRPVRGAMSEETKQLSIRMPVSLYREFLEFADGRKLTYSEAIRELLERQ